jgi:pentatricopeptide repeat protein
MYAKSGDFDSAEVVFQSMPCRDTTSWNSVISGSIFNGLAEDAAWYFREMICSIFQPDEVSLSSVLSACFRLDDLFCFGESAHSCAVKLGYETASCSVANSLMTFYSEFGMPEAAEKVFASTLNRNLVSWNAMIRGLVQNERITEALAVLREMRLENRPDVATLVTIISGCGDQGLLSDGKALHGYIIRIGLLHEESSVGNSLLGLYLKCNEPSNASLLFRTMPRRDLISWNTMISGYSRNDLLREEAQLMFKELLSEGLSCSLTTMLAVIPSCSNPEELSFGQVLHSFILKCGFTCSGVSAVNALMHMYMSCGDPLTAFLLIERMVPATDIVSWNTIIVGCLQNGLDKDALEAFQFMYCSLAIKPDSITLVSVLSACGNLNLLAQGKYIHCMILKHLLASNLRVKNSLLTMYFRFGDTRSAELVFYSMGDTNLCSWNCMISGFAQNNKGWRALQFYQKMEDSAPNEITVVGIICACTQLGDYRQGKSIHGHVVRSGLHNNVFISASLVDMYCKCGRLDIAVRVFEASAEKSIAGWNSMISAFGFHGHGLKSIELFWKMNDSGMKATKSTFIALLSACSHSGLVDEGWKYYRLMSEKFGIIPAPEHHVCIVDMLGRAGRLEEAHKFVESLPSQQVHGVWGAMLNACSSGSELKMGESIAKHLLRLEPGNSGYYVTVSNLYAYRDMWSVAVQVRSVLQDKGLVKPHGHSIVG